MTGHPCFKAIVCFAIVAFLAVASRAAAANLELSLPTVEAKPAETVKAAVKAKDGAGLGSLQMEVAFDPKSVEIVAVEAGQLLTNGMVEFNVAGDRCKIALLSSDPVAGAGDLLTLTLRPRDGGSAKSALTAQNPQAWDNETLQPMNVTVAEGAVRLAGGADGASGLVGYALYGLGLVAAAGAGLVAGRKFGGATGGPTGGTCPKCGTRAGFCQSCGAGLRA